MLGGLINHKLLLFISKLTDELNLMIKKLMIGILQLQIGQILRSKQYELDPTLL